MNVSALPLAVHTWCCRCAPTGVTLRYWAAWAQHSGAALHTDTTAATTAALLRPGNFMPALRPAHLSQSVFWMCISSCSSQRVEATLCPKQHQACGGGGGRARGGG